MRYEALAQKGNIGKLELKNRIVVPALNNNYTHAAFMTDESIDFYVSKAKGGAGLVIVEATSVDYPRSRSVLNPAIDHDQYLPGFQKIAEGCHRYGAKVVVQLSHVGRQTRRSTTGMDPVAPSPIAGNSPLYPDTPKVLELSDIEEIVEKFASAAERSKRAGLDGVELILGHGYLMNNFLTPASNQRTDIYGGLKGGIKFSVDIIRAIKQRCGEDYPIICRLNGDDYIKAGGNTPVEAQLIAQALEAAGVDAINVSGGMRDSELSFNDHTSGMPHGSWLHLSERIKRVIGIPVIAVKRLTPQIANDAILHGQTDFAAFGKQFIADSDYANKVLEGRLEDVIPCTSCCQGCYDTLWQKKPITCMVNPKVGRTMEYIEARAAKKGSKRVLVVGAGPAGCEAALELAKKGHSVTLIEKTGTLGGNYNSLRFTKAKQEVSMVFTYLHHALTNYGVDIRKNTPFSNALLDELKPDAVVDATGANFKTPPIEGANLPIVVNPIEAIDGSHEIGEYVVIVTCDYHCAWTCRKTEHEIPDDVTGMKTSESHACSAGHAAADVAEELAARGKKVMIITGRDSFAPGMGFTNRGNLFKRFFPKNITVASSVKVKQILPDGLLCEKDGISFKACADTIVLSTALTPRNTVEQALVGNGCAFYRVGDCEQIGNALEAFRRAYELADQI